MYVVAGTGFLPFSFNTSFHPWNIYLTHIVLYVSSIMRFSVQKYNKVLP